MNIAALLIVTLFAFALAESEISSSSGSSEESTRIFNGFNSTRGQFSHQALLLISLEKHRSTVCGGSLISNHWILTAASCVYQIRSIEVHLGAFKTNHFREEGRIIRYAYPSSITVYPYYVSDLALNDIALLRLEEPVEFSDNIQPIALPKSGEYYHDAQAIASGFGLQNTTEVYAAPILQWAPFSTINNLRCAGFFNNIVSTMVLRPSILCAIGLRNASVCLGDGGGPLINRERVLIGITSFVSTSGCHLGYPSTFTRVTYFLEWIGEVTGIEPEM